MLQVNTLCDRLLSRFMLVDATFLFEAPFMSNNTTSCTLLTTVSVRFSTYTPFFESSRNCQQTKEKLKTKKPPSMTCYTKYCIQIHATCINKKDDDSCWLENSLSLYRFFCVPANLWKLVPRGLWSVHCRFPEMSICTHISAALIADPALPAHSSNKVSQRVLNLIQVTFNFRLSIGQKKIFFCSFCSYELSTIRCAAPWVPVSIFLRDSLH